MTAGATRSGVLTINPFQISGDYVVVRVALFFIGEKTVVVLFQKITLYIYSFLHSFYTVSKGTVLWNSFFCDDQKKISFTNI